MELGGLGWAVRGRTPENWSTLNGLKGLLGGSWVVRSRVISRVTILITPIGGLITLQITTHEPASNARPWRVPSKVPGRATGRGPLASVLQGLEWL